MRFSKTWIAVAIGVCGSLQPAWAGNYCFLGPGMGCGNNTGKADSTSVRPIGPAPQLPDNSSVLPPTPSLDTMSQAALAAANNQLQKYSTGYGVYGPLPAGYKNVMQLPLTTPGSYSATDNCGTPTTVYPFLAYNGTTYVVDFWSASTVYCN
jgi:hypothetical protein